ncbi:MAG: ribose 5-phosphate isomerase B [Rhodospirillales bacterium]
MKIAIASDHAGFNLKSILCDDLVDAGHQIEDLGTHSTDSVDYPDFGYSMAQAVRSGDVDRGVLVCGTGIGISMAANRFPEVRAAVVDGPTAARLCREHNDANVICFGERMIGVEVARESLRVFLATEFAGGRHAGRVAKLSQPMTD